MNFVQNILWNSIEGFVEAGTRTAGGYAGDALLKAGDLIEGAGRSVGNGIERTASSYGTKLSSGAPPTTAKKPAVKRSHSSPASSKPFSTATKTATRGPTSKIALGENKYPGGKTTTGTKSTVGGAQKSITSAGTKAVGTQKALTNTATKAISSTVGGVKKPSTTLPKPYPNSASYGTPKTAKPSTSTLSKPNNTSFANSTEKKTAVRPNGPPKPFNPPKTNNTLGGAKAGTGNDARPYPGTNTLPGQGNRTPVQKQKYKPLPRMEGTAERGKATFF